MGKKDPRVDAYIGRSPDFAKPVMKYLRAVIHNACPEVEETLKWGSPHFMYKGMLCGMASFKNHCAFGFWKGKLISFKGGKQEAAMGQFGRIGLVSDLPGEKELAG